MKRRFARIELFLAAISLAALPKFALATIWWSGNGNGVNWGTANNWSISSSANGAAPNPLQIDTNDLIFNVDGRNGNTNNYTTNLNANRSPASLQFRGSGLLQIGPGTSGNGANNLLSIGNSGLQNSSGGTLSISSRFETRGNSHTWSNSGSLNIQNTLIISGNSLTIGGSGTTTITGNIQSTTAAITKNGAGVLAIGGSAAYTGNTTINSGAIRLDDNNRLSDSTNVIINAGTFDVNGHDETIGTLSGVGTVSLGGGTLTTGANNGSTTYSGVIGGSGGLTKNGTGTFTLSGNNTYSGATTIANGTLQLGASHRISDNSSVVISGGTFALNGFGETIGSLAGSGGVVSLGTGTLVTGDNGTSTTYSGVITGSGGLLKSGSGIFTISGANDYTGATTINGGTLLLGNHNRISDVSDLVINGGSFGLGIYSDTVGSLSGSGGVGLAGGTLTTGTNNTSTTYSGTMNGTGGLTKIGTGTLTFSGVKLSGGTVTVNNGTLQLGNHQRFSDQNDLVVNAGTFALAGFGQSVGSLSGGGAVSTGGGIISVGANNSSTTFSGVISGTGGLTKTGSGALSLSGANDYTGATTINSGTLQLLNHNRISDASDVVIGTGTFGLNGFSETIGSLSGGGTVSLASGSLTTGGNNSSTTYTGVISGSGGLTKIGTGTLILSGANDYTGATTINNGTLQLGNHNRISDSSSVVINAGSLALNGFSDTVGSLAGAGTVSLGSGSLTTGGNNSSTTYSGVITGSGGLTKTGSGALSLSGANDYTGATSINSGTLQLLNHNRISDASDVVIGTGTFGLNGFNETIGSLSGGGAVSLGSGTLTTANNASTTYSGVISGSGGLTKSGTGTLILSGANDYTGATTINNGTLQLGNHNRISDSSSVVINAGSFVLNGFSDTVGSLAGGGTVSLASGSLTTGGNNSSTTYTGVISGSGGLTKSGTGTLILSGANDYTGATTINNGTLQLGNHNRISDSSSVVINAGSLALNGFSDTVGSLAGAGTVSLGSGSLTTGGNNSSTTYSGVISGSGGSLTKVGTGTLTLAGANTYTGNTTIDAGRLTVNGSASGPVTVNSGGTLGGSGTIHGNVSGNGRVAPGNSPGIITIDGNYTQTADSTLEIEVGGLSLSPVVQHDQVRVGGVATLGGLYEFKLVNGFVPNVGDEIKFIDTFGTGSIAAGTRPRQVTAPGLDTAAPNVSFRVVSTTGAGGNVKLQYVSANDINFDGSGNADWFVGGAANPNWDLNRNPALSDYTYVTNFGGNAQTVSINTNDPDIDTIPDPEDNIAEVRNLVVGEANADPTKSITVAVETGFGLRAKVGNVQIADSGTIELRNADLIAPASSQKVDIQSGGLLAGNGTVTTGQLLVSGGTLRPGFSVGHLDIVGGYKQEANGTLLVDIENNGAHDSVDISGAAELHGTLKIDASQLTTLVPGRRHEILDAVSLTGKFDDVVASGNNSVYFLMEYDYLAGTAKALEVERGDMNGDIAFNTIDDDLFVYGLMNEDFDKYATKCHCTVTRQQGGDFSGNLDLDFNDIAGYKDMLRRRNRPVNALDEAFRRYQAAVPEPATLVLMTILLTIFISTRLVRRSKQPVAIFVRGQM